MQNETTTNPPPDWAAQEKDLLCPLCGYNLRGLTESRCPECGFKFTWQELLEAEKNKHIYLFEYGKGRNIRTFWKTYWRTCRPRRFWRELNPAQGVSWFRLILYWVLSSSMILGLWLIPYARPAWDLGYRNLKARSAFVEDPGRPGYFVQPGWGQNSYAFSANALDDFLPPPWQPKFWHEVEDKVANATFVIPLKPSVPISLWADIFLAWPIATLIALTVFRISIRQAKIKWSHLIRSVIYSCDFGLFMLAGAIAIPLLAKDLSENWFLAVFMALCMVITTYRLTIAFRQYLRVHLPLATVLASHVITFLIVFIALVQIADFSRRI